MGVTEDLFSGCVCNHAGLPCILYFYFQALLISPSSGTRRRLAVAVFNGRDDSTDDDADGSTVIV